MTGAMSGSTRFFPDCLLIDKEKRSTFITGSMDEPADGCLPRIPGDHLFHFRPELFDADIGKGIFLQGY